MRSRVWLLLSLVMLACSELEAPSARRAAPPGREDILSQGGIANGGFDQWSASGTYSLWPPGGWSLMFASEGYGDKAPPCLDDNVAVAAQPSSVTGWCNAGQGRSDFGVLTLPTVSDPLVAEQHFAILATEDLFSPPTKDENDKEVLPARFYPVLRSAVKVPREFFTVSGTGRVMLGFDFAFLTGQKDGGPLTNDFASIEFRPEGGSPPTEVFRVDRDLLQPGGQGPLTNVVHRNADQSVSCGTSALGGVATTYTMCTDWRNAQIDLTGLGLAGRVGQFVIRLEEVGTTYAEAAATARQSSAFAIANLTIAVVPPAESPEGSAVQVGDAAPDPAMLRTRPSYRLDHVEWSYDTSRCSIGAGEANALTVHFNCRDNGIATIWQYFVYNRNIESQPPTDIIRVYHAVDFANATPSVGDIAGIPAAPVAAGSPVTISAPFTDAGTLDTHTGTVTWDDGEQPAVAAVTESNGSGTVTASRSLPAGVYTVTLNVRDDDGAVGSTGTAPDFLVVADASFAAAGRGWIESRPGALTARPRVGGRGYFGFVAQYLDGAIVPCRNTRFRLRLLDLTFESTSYESITLAGPRVTYAGSGMVNGRAGFGFRVTAVDGQTAGGDGIDKFRIKIWNVQTGVVVYDSGLGAADDGDSGLQPLGRGRIRVRVR